MPTEGILKRAQMLGLLVGIGALVVLAIGFFIDPTASFEGYLIGLLYWASIPIGAIALLSIHHLTGGYWGWVIRPYLGSAVRTMPLILLFFVPMIAGVRYVYEWADPQIVAHDPLLQEKQPYLNVPFFLWRTLGYLIIWWMLGLAMTRRHLENRLRPRVGAPSLLLYLFMGTFAAIDWGMSLEPHWFSSMYGVLAAVSWSLQALCFAIAASWWVGARAAGEKDHARPQTLIDLGNLILAHVMLWAYLNFSQYIIIWSGNLAEDQTWFIRRSVGVWPLLAVFLILVQFFVPFFVLLMRKIKRRYSYLATIAIALVGLRLLDTVWVIAPSYHHGGLLFAWQTIVAVVALGGLWLSVYAWQLSGRLPHAPEPPEPPAEDSHD